jgi:polyisoprenoid-binding protein YceI
MVCKFILFALVLTGIVLAACATAPAPAAIPASASNPVSSVASSSSASSASASVASSSVASSSLPSDTVKLVIVPSASEARFRAREVLAGNTLPNDAVGTTKAIEGTIIGKMDGSIVSAQSKVRVDLRTLKSDQAMRDNFIKQDTLNTSKYPYADFVLIEAPGLPKALPADGQVNFQLVGDMTIRDVTKRMTWDVKSQVKGDVVTGTAVSKFTFALFNMTKPNVARVLSIEDTVQLELDFTLQRVYN